jgi:hypothetical protein
MPVLATGESDRFLNASMGTTTYLATVTPIKLALFTVIGTAAATGTEVTGGSYARQSITVWTTASGGTGCSNTTVGTFLNMPAATVVAIELFDSTGSPVRKWFGGLTANKTTALGDTLSFAAGSIVLGAT